MSAENNGVQSNETFEKCSVVLVDVLGTTTSISFAKETLFPFVIKHVEEILKEKWEDDAVKEAVKQLKESEELDLGGVIKLVKELTENGSENVGLKTIQGLIYNKGFDGGDLKGHVFSDVAPCFETWSRSRKIMVYSTGSVNSQKQLFAHTNEGDLTSHISKFFDQSVGVKTEAGSYKKIVEDLTVKPEEILFLTDNIEEGKAAKSAGLSVALVKREGNAELPEDSKSFMVISSFKEISFENPSKRKNPGDEVATEEPPSKLAKTESKGEVEPESDKKNEEKTENKETVENEAMEVDAPVQEDKQDKPKAEINETKERKTTEKTETLEKTEEKEVSMDTADSTEEVKKVEIKKKVDVEEKSEVKETEAKENAEKKVTEEDGKNELKEAVKGDEEMVCDGKDVKKDSVKENEAEKACEVKSSEIEKKIEVSEEKKQDDEVDSTSNSKKEEPSTVKNGIEEKVDSTEAVETDKKDETDNKVESSQVKDEKVDKCNSSEAVQKEDTKAEIEKSNKTEEPKSEEKVDSSKPDEEKTAKTVMLEEKTESKAEEKQGTKVESDDKVSSSEEKTETDSKLDSEEKENKKDLANGLENGSIKENTDAKVTNGEASAVNGNSTEKEMNGKEEKVEEIIVKKVEANATSTDVPPVSVEA